MRKDAQIYNPHSPDNEMEATSSEQARNFVPVASIVASTSRPVQIDSVSSAIQHRLFQLFIDFPADHFPAAHFPADHFPADHFPADIDFQFRYWPSVLFYSGVLLGKSIRGLKHKKLGDGGGDAACFGIERCFTAKSASVHLG